MAHEIVNNEGMALGTESGRKKRVLIVDDEARILNFLRTKLNATGYEVLTATSGDETLREVKANEPDMVLLDLVMPGKDGFETLRELRAFSCVPVIIFTAKGEEAKSKGLELGADDYLAKPFNPDDLIARIESVFSRRLAGAS